MSNMARPVGEWDTPWAVQKAAQDQIGGPVDPMKDVAFPPPLEFVADPKLAREVAQSATYREIPLITLPQSWTVAAIRNALGSLIVGVFEQPGYLCDVLLGDDRIQATIGSRVGGLLGAPVKFTRAEEDGDGACYDAWRKNWHRIGAEAPWSTFLTYTHLAGFQSGQLGWDTTNAELWVPCLQPEHMAFEYYHWPLRRYIFVSLDGQVAIEGGNAKWVLHAPHGEYRGWMRGAMRALAQPWIMRHYALRDWARFNEIHGIPTRVGKVPAAADAKARAWMNTQINNVGASASMILPQGVDEQNSYGFELVEAEAGEWESFKAEIDQCDMQIVLTLLYQNLTTEVQEGSFAAARVHAAVRQAALKADARALSHTIYNQVARPFASINFGSPDLAPMTEWDVTPDEDYNARADVLVKWTNALKALKDAGFKFIDKKALKEFAATFGFMLPDDGLEEHEGPEVGAGGGPNAEPRGTKPTSPGESQRKPAGDGE